MAIALPLVIAAAATAVQAYGHYQAGKSQQYELERQAEEEKIAAQSRELQRRQQLNKVLSANIVGQATSGITGDGTPQSIALESAKQASISEGVMNLSDRLQQAQLQRQAKNARRTGKLQAASTLLNTAAGFAKG